MENEYGVFFNIEDKNPVTMKSIKTKKSFKTNNSNKSRRHITGHYTAMMKLRLDNVDKNEGTGNKIKNVQPVELKNFDMIRTAIGERPK